VGKEHGQPSPILLYVKNPSRNVFLELGAEMRV